MRVTYVILPCVVLVVVGLAFVFGRKPTRPVPSMRTPATSAPESAPATRAPAGLACIQDALGGVKAFAAVSSLRIIGNTKPVETTGRR